MQHDYNLAAGDHSCDDIHYNSTTAYEYDLAFIQKLYK